MTDKKIDKDAANDIDLLQDVVGRARKAGADAADAVLFEGTSLSHARRLGKTEKLERSESQDLGLRVLIGKRQAIVSTSDRSPKMLAELVERTLAMARAVPDDPFCGLADPAEITHDWPALDMLDPVEPSAEALIERARAAEETALPIERPRHQLSARQARATDLSRGDHDHRRPTPAAWPTLEAIRRRGDCQPPPRDYRQGRVDHLAARFALGAPARPQDDRPCRARH